MAGMAPAAQDNEGTQPLSLKSLQEVIKSAVLEVEAKVTKKMEQLFSLVKAQLPETQSSLDKMGQVAEMALKTGIVLPEKSQTHQNNIAELEEKYLVLAAAQRENKLGSWAERRH